MRDRKIPWMSYTYLPVHVLMQLLYRVVKEHYLLEWFEAILISFEFHTQIYLHTWSSLLRNGFIMLYPRVRYLGASRTWMARNQSGMPSC